MGSNDIALSAGIRNSLLALQDISSAIGMHQQRLATGRRVNTPLDNPTNYFAASAAKNRADALAQRKDEIGQAINVVKTATTGLEAIGQLLASGKAIAETATTTTNSIERDRYAAIFNTVLDQIDTLASNSTYAGTNLMANDSMTVQFSEQTGKSSFQVNGIDGSSGSLGIKQITTPPLEAYNGGTTSVTWNDVRSQVIIDFSTGGNTLSDIVPKSVSIVDANNNVIHPDAQYTDSDTGTISFYFTPPPAGNSYTASWEVTKNVNKFVINGLKTPPQAIVVSGAQVAPSKYSLSSSRTGLAVTFASGQEPQPGESVQYISGYQVTGPVQSVRVNNSANSNYSINTSANGDRTIVFNVALPTSPTQQNPDVQYQLRQLDPMQPRDLTWYTANPVFQDNITPNVGAYPRPMTGSSVGQTERMMIWSDSKVKKSLSQIEQALETVRATASSFQSSDTILTARSTFIENMVKILNTGADSLTLADMNEEGAGMLMLETRQSLAITSLSLANEAAKGTLKLFF